MRPVEKTADHRRSRRYASRLDVELAQGSATQRCYSIDVSRHGIFLATERPPRERFLVRVVIQLPDGALFANAFVSRSVPPGTAHPPGVGLQFFAMPEMTRKRWDRYVTWLSGVAAPADADAVASSFMVKLPDRAKLREFFEKVSRTTNIYMVTPVVRPVGSPVAVVLVHPETKLEFVLSGKIARVRLEAPKGVEIRLTPLTVGDIEAFHGFLGGDDPEEAWPAPPSAPVPAPPDPDLEPLMPFDGAGAAQSASLHATLPRPSFPAEPVVRSGDVAPISADLPKAISVDIGGPEAEPDKVTAEQRFDWSVVSDDLVIDVDLSEIEGEDLAELRGEINVRITRPPTRVPTADLPEYVLDGASDLIPLPKPSGAPAPASEPAPAPAPAPISHRDAELPQEISASPTHERATADLRHLPRARPLSRSEDAKTGSTRPSDPTQHSSGDVFRELTPPPQPRRLRSTVDLDDDVLPVPSSPPPMASSPPVASEAPMASAPVARAASSPPVAPPPVASSPPVAPPPVASSPPVAPPPVASSPPVAPPPVASSPPVAPPPVASSPPVAAEALALTPPSAAPSSSADSAPAATMAPADALLAPSAGGEPPRNGVSGPAVHDLAPPVPLHLPPPATTRPDLPPAAAVLREVPEVEEPLDEDEPSDRARSEASLPAEPAEDSAPGDDEYPALDPVRSLDLRCAHCGTSSKLKAGHPAPPLGLFASYRTYSCKKCRLFVSVLRLASSRTRGIVKKVLEASGGLDGPAPLSVAFDVADLAQPARCPDCTSMLRVTKQTDAIEAALDTGGSEPQTLSKVSCPRCHEYGVKLGPG